MKPRKNKKPWKGGEAFAGKLFSRFQGLCPIPHTCKLKMSEKIPPIWRQSFFVNLIAKIQHCQQLGVISAPPEDIHLGERLTFNILCLSYNKDICNLTPENRSCFTSCTRLTCLFRLLAESSSLKCAFSDFSRWSISSTLLHYISFEIQRIIQRSKSTHWPPNPIIWRVEAIAGLPVMILHFDKPSIQVDNNGIRSI